MSKRKRLRKLMQLQAAATIRQLPAPVNSVPAPAQTEASSSPASKQKALTLLWDMLHQKLQSVTNTPDLITCAKLIERFMRIELAERKQDHAERKLALAREKQELAAKKFALAQLKFQQKNQSQPLSSSNSSPNSTAPEAKANTPGHSQNTELQPLSIPSPALPAASPITLTPSFIEELAPSDSQTAHLKHPFTAENPFTPTAPPSQIAV